MTLLSNRQPAPELLFEHDLTQNRGPIGDRTIMKTLPLLVLSMAAAAREATAQEDAQCVRERAAMVETIRAYARSDASVLGQQGLSERVLEAMGQTKRHLFIPERSRSIAYADRPVPIGHDRLRPSAILGRHHGTHGPGHGRSIPPAQVRVDRPYASVHSHVPFPEREA